MPPPVVTGSRTPFPTHTRAPLQLRPQVQFGHADPGSSAHYGQVLSNSLISDTLVTLAGLSKNGWAISVVPPSLIAHPGMQNPISVTVSVPLSPTVPVDVERTTASIGGAHPYTATAYIITFGGSFPFNDVASDHWAAGPVQYLASTGVVGGYADGSFRPNANVTRAQFAKMLTGAMEWDLVTPSSPTFSDVASDYWAYSYIETAAAHGVLGGYADGTFHPSANVTRAQVAKMITTSMDWTMDNPITGSFTDAGEQDWFTIYAETARAAEVMGGYADGTFRPNAPATRAQIAKILTLSLFSSPNN